jgi:cytochrome c biogenesis protein CcdA
MAEHGERIAVLETDVRNHKDTLNDVVDKLEELNKTVTSINSKLDKNMGFLAGAAFVFSLFGAVTGFFGSYLLKKLG